MVECLDNCAPVIIKLSLAWLMKQMIVKNRLLSKCNESSERNPSTDDVKNITIE